MQLKPFTQFRFFVPPGTHYCWVARGNVDSNIAQGFYKWPVPPGIEPQTSHSQVQRLNHSPICSTVWLLEKRVKRAKWELFYRCGDEGCSEPVSHAVVFIPNDLHHDHHAVRVFNNTIQAEMKHLKHLKLEHHVQFSDGCSSQYKSKGPFYDVQCTNHSFEKAFFGSRHGKSPCDTLHITHSY